MNFLGYFYIPNFLCAVFIILISLYFFGRRTFGVFTNHGIKGPKPITYIGNLIPIGKVGIHEIVFTWKKEYGDVYGIFFGTQPHLVITDPEMIEEVMVKSFSNFTNRTLTVVSNDYSANMVSAAKDEHWKYLRTVMAPFYSSKRMREMVPLIEDVLKTFEKNLNKIADGKKPTNINLLFSGYTMDVIASTGFGIKVDSQENPDSPFVKNAHKFFDEDFLKSLQGLAMIFPMVSKILYKIKPSLSLGSMYYFVEFCKELFEERRKEKNSNSSKDLLQLMLDAQLEDHDKLNEKIGKELKLKNISDWRTKRGFTDVEIIAQCMFLLLAGFETTASSLSYFAHSVAVNPDIQDKLCLEIEKKLGQESPNYDNVEKLTYLDMCMKETLRLYPIGPATSRETREDCIIKGVKISKDMGIMIPIICLHHDSKYWTHPDKFYPEHFNEENKAKQKPFTYLPFGGGPRICAGMRLAQLEFKMAVVQMLRNFRLVACEKTEKKITFMKAIFLKPKNGIWLKIEKR